MLSCWRGLLVPVPRVAASRVTGITPSVLSKISIGSLRLYGALTWLRMGNPTPGVWLTPHVEAVDELRSVIARFGLTYSAICFTGRTEDIGLSDDQIVRRAWNLSELAESYRALLTRYTHHRPAAGDEVLLSYLELRNLLQRFLRLDPQLPEELLPDWVGHEAAELFRSRRDQWASAARERWIPDAAGAGAADGRSRSRVSRRNPASFAWHAA